LLKVIILLDLPGALLAFLMSLPLTLIFYGASMQVQSWIEAVIFLIGTSIQWWLVGYGLHSLWNQR
jgi:quinol-cytochrome oxidoreductase complex cytochrome b subunit